MATQRNMLQSLRRRSQGIGRLLLPAVAVTLLCPTAGVCAGFSPAAAGTVIKDETAHAGHGIATHDHYATATATATAPAPAPAPEHSDDTCPHCPTLTSSMSSARTSCDVAAADAPPSAKLPHDLQLFAPAIPSAPATPHPSLPRTAYSTGSGPPAVPLNLLHCVFLI